MSSSPLQKIIYYLLIIWAAVIPSGFYVANFTFAILLFICSFTIRPAPKGLFKHKTILLPTLLFAIVAVGFFFSLNRSAATSTLSIYLPYAIVPFTIAKCVSLPSLPLKNIYRSFILSLSGSLLVCIVYGIADIYSSGESFIALNGLYNYPKLSSFGLTRLFYDWHPTYVATFIIWALLLLAHHRNETALFPRVLQIFLVVFLIANLILLNSIAALAAFIAVGSLWTLQLLVRKGVGKIYLFLVLLIILFSTVALVYFNPIKNEKIATLEQRGLKITDAEGERNFLTIRLAKWLVHADVFRKHPIFGTTAGDIKDERKLGYYYRGFINLGEANYNAHNEFLDMLCRFGIVGFVVFISWLLWPIQRKRVGLYEYFLLASTIVFLTESFLERQQGLFAFLFFYSIITLSRLRTDHIEGSLP